MVFHNKYQKLYSRSEGGDLQVIKHLFILPIFCGTNEYCLETQVEISTDLKFIKHLLNLSALCKVGLILNGIFKQEILIKQSFI